MEEQGEIPLETLLSIDVSGLFSVFRGKRALETIAAEIGDNVLSPRSAPAKQDFNAANYLNSLAEELSFGTLSDILSYSNSVDLQQARKVPLQRDEVFLRDLAYNLFFQLLPVLSLQKRLGPKQASHLYRRLLSHNTALLECALGDDLEVSYHPPGFRGLDSATYELALLEKEVLRKRGNPNMIKLGAVAGYLKSEEPESYFSAKSADSPEYLSPLSARVEANRMLV